MDYKAELPDASVNVDKNRMLVNILASTAITVVAFIVIYLGSIYSLKYSIKYLPKSFENSLNSYFSRTTKTTSANMADRLRVKGIIDLLKQHSEFDKINFNIGIIKQKAPNAFAAPGYYIGVTKGLLDSSETDNELAFVLAHELGHYSNRDHAVGFINNILNTILLYLTPETAQEMTGHVIRTLTLSSIRGSESRADLYAIELLHKTFDDVCGWEGFFRRLMKEEKTLRKLTRYASTHPLSEERIKNVKKFIKLKSLNDCI